MLFFLTASLIVGALAKHPHGDWIELEAEKPLVSDAARRIW
jgi:hypothetical protein